MRGLSYFQDGVARKHRRIIGRPGICHLWSYLRRGSFELVPFTTCPVRANIFKQCRTWLCSFAMQGFHKNTMTALPQTNMEAVRGLEWNQVFQRGSFRISLGEISEAEPNTELLLVWISRLLAGMWIMSLFARSDLQASGLIALHVPSHGQFHGRFYVSKGVAMSAEPRVNGAVQVVICKQRGNQASKCGRNVILLTVVGSVFVGVMATRRNCPNVFEFAGVHPDHAAGHFPC